MIIHLRGQRAARLVLTSIVATGCPAGDENDDTTTNATTSTETDPSTSMSMSTTEDPSTSTTEDPGTSTTDEPTTDDPTTDSTGLDSGDTSTTEPVGLEIIGEWTDGFGGEHVISDEQWATTFAPDTFTYTITEYDNAERYIIAQDDGDETWTKYEWTYVDADLYYCQSAFGEAAPADALRSPDADPADPVNAGCGMFPWSLLTPPA